MRLLLWFVHTFFDQMTYVCVYLGRMFPPLSVMTTTTTMITITTIKSEMTPEAMKIFFFLSSMANEDEQFGVLTSNLLF